MLRDPLYCYTKGRRDRTEKKGKKETKKMPENLPNLGKKTDRHLGPGQSLGWEDPLEEEMATCSRILAWEILWTEKP